MSMSRSSASDHSGRNCLALQHKLLLLKIPSWLAIYNQEHADLQNTTHPAPCTRAVPSQCSGEAYEDACKHVLRAKCVMLCNMFAVIQTSSADQRACNLCATDVPSNSFITFACVPNPNSPAPTFMHVAAPMALASSALSRIEKP